MAQEFLDLDHRVGCEHLIDELTEEVLKRQPLTEFIRTALRILGEAFRISRIHLFQYHRDKGRVVEVAEWVGSGTVPSPADAKEFRIDRFSRLTDRLLVGNGVCIDDFRAVKDQYLHAFMERSKTKSLLCLPFEVFGMPYGFMGFEECRVFRKWQKEDVELLRSACRILAQVIEKDRWENEMVGLERVASMGRLAGMVAHEINNPLQAMLLHLDLIRPAVEKNAGAKRNLSHIENGVRRICAIVGRILSLHREHTETEDVDINDLVKGVLVLLERYFERANCACNLNLAADLPAVRGMRQMIHQVIFNVVVNAMESVSTRGIIDIATRLDDGAVCVEIRDNGIGIEKEHLPYIFAPFFTTKISPHPGLGLFVAHTVVADHKGTIAVDSHVGVGTTVTIRLPVRLH